MRRAVILACLWAAPLLAGSEMAAASDQCLSPAELSNVGRMASVMAIGVAVQRCSRCLGPDRYPQMVKTYQDDELIGDFWQAQKAFDENKDRERFIHIDGLVRDSARKISSTLSADCDACRKTAALLERLSSAHARGAFYQSETDVLAKDSKIKTCPQARPHVLP